VVDIILITAAAGLIIGVLNLTGLSFGLTLVLVELSAKTLMILLVTAAGISIILGMGMPTIGVYVLLAALVAPSMVERGVEPIAAHLFVLYFGMMSMITPPVAIAAFAATSLGKADPLQTALEAMRLGWPAYVVPFLFVMSPSLLFIGDGAGFAVAFVTAIGGVWLVSIGLVGYFVRSLTVVRRLLFALAGLALMMPAGVFEGALVATILGALDDKPRNPSNKAAALKASRLSTSAASARRCRAHRRRSAPECCHRSSPGPTSCPPRGRCTACRPPAVS